MGKDLKIVGPQPITLEEYRRRVTPKQKETPLIIPKTKPPKRRGGFLVKKRRELSNLKRIINSSPPPSWEVSSRLWVRIAEVEQTIEAYMNMNKNKKLE